MGLPPPLQLVRFHKTTLGDTKMRVAELPSGPFFLERAQFQLLRRFAEGKPQRDRPKLLAVVGPVKSGKSAVLMDVLPGLFASAHAKAAGDGPTPVIFPFTFDEADAPEAAALRLLSSASRFASTIGLTLVVPATTQLALLTLGDVMGELARKVHEDGGELCILLDELQVGDGSGC